MLSSLVYVVILGLSAQATYGQVCQGDMVEFSGYGKLAQSLRNATVSNLVMNQSRDFSRKMESIRQVVTTKINNVVYQEKQLIIRDYNKMIEYLAMPDKKQCYKMNLTTPMESYCSLNMSRRKLVGSLEVDGVMVDLYEEERDGQKITTSVLRNSTIAVAAVVEQTFRNIPQMIALQLGNYTKGIKDPKVFDIPEYCTAEPRCFPDQWEGIGLAKAASSNANFTGVSDVNMKISWDYERKLELIVETVETAVNGTPYVTDLEVHRDYNTMIETTVNTKLKTCTKKKMTFPMYKLCENDPKMQLVGTLDVAGSMVDTYEVGLGNSTKVTVSILRRTFFPVASVSETFYDGTGSMVAMQFGNRTLGISDPTVFKLPSYCLA